MQDNQENERILAEITPQGPRRVVAVAMLLALGGLLAYLTFTMPAGPVFVRLLLVLAAALALVLADRVRRATLSQIQMTDDVIRDTSGLTLCRLEDVTSVERGAFAFKPSNGFLIRTTNPGSRVWMPGLWWRFGRRIGVGGVTSASQAKFMAELIALRLRGDLDVLNPRPFDQDPED